jgi:HK97 gp10 family phage protein
MANNRFSNKSRALKRMAALPAAIKVETKAALLKNAVMVMEAQRQAAPVDDGDLRESGKVKDISDSARIAVQVGFGDEKAFYARMVEFGTPKQHAQPFFYPVYRSLKKRVIASIARAAGKGARKAVGGQ